MPISEKIKKEIDGLNEDEQFKNLMLDILKLEDDGAKRWKNEYKKNINSYLGLENEEDK